MLNKLADMVHFIKTYSDLVPRRTESATLIVFQCSALATVTTLLRWCLLFCKWGVFNLHIYLIFLTSLIVKAQDQPFSDRPIFLPVVLGEADFNHTQSNQSMRGELTGVLTIACYNNVYMAQSQ
jgi:hypothetical protein